MSELSLQKLQQTLEILADANTTEEKQKKRLKSTKQILAAKIANELNAKEVQRRQQKDAEE